MKKLNNTSTIYEILLVLVEKDSENYEVLCANNQTGCIVELKKIPKNLTTVSRHWDYEGEGTGNFIEYNNGRYEISYGMYDITRSRNYFNLYLEEFLGGSTLLRDEMIAICKSEKRDPTRYY